MDWALRCQAVQPMESPGTGRKYTAGCCDNRYKNALYEWPGTGAEVK